MTTAARSETAHWVAPGPGTWERDAAHQDRPWSTLLIEALAPAMASGSREAFARFGIPFSAVETAGIDGWFFGTFAPMAEDAFPERAAAAEIALEERPWRTIAEEWDTTLRAQFTRQNRALQSAALDSLDDAELAAHIGTALQQLTSAATRHFYDAVAHWVGVGLLVNEADRIAGWPPERTIAALAGASPASTAPVVAARRAAAAINADPRARTELSAEGNPAAILDALRACSPAVCEAIDDYVAEHGWQIFTGFDFTHQAIIELPGVLLATFRAVPPAGGPPPDLLAELVEAAQPADRERVRQRIADAVLAYGLRDDDSGPAAQLPIGLVRRALLEAGRRLVACGRLHDADDIFDATAAEIALLLAGGGDDALRAEIAARADRRRHPQVPPRQLGSDEPPPDGQLPAAMEIVTNALFAALALEDRPESETVAGLELRGAGASAGIYEGRARLIRGEGDFERLERGDVLVSAITTPAYNVILPLLGAVVTDRGGVLSHPAIVAREYGIPAVVGTGQATARIPDGARIRVDGLAGTVTILG